MTSAPPTFPSIAIVGLGLIGGSIALGVRERWPQSRVFGVGSESVLAHAVGAGGREAGAAGRSRDGRFRADRADQSAGRQNIITDVGGTKRDIVNAARALPPGITFVGGHPLGDGKRGSFAFAGPDLFAGRPWIFTPDGDASAAAVDRLSRLVTGLGAK